MSIRYYILSLPDIFIEVFYVYSYTVKYRILMIEKRQGAGVRRQASGVRELINLIIIYKKYN